MCELDDGWKFSLYTRIWDVIVSLLAFVVDFLCERVKLLAAWVWVALELLPDLLMRVALTDKRESVVNDPLPSKMVNIVIGSADSCTLARFFATF